MKLTIQQGRITGIKEQELNPVLPESDLSFVTDKDLYREIRNYIKSEHGDIERQSTFEEGVMKHSNPSLAVAVDMFFKNHHPEYRLATQFQLEQDLDFTRGTYNDSGLALRSLTGFNEEQARHLYEQLKKRNPKIEFPIFCDLRGLELDSNLNFNLTDESRYKTAKCLNWSSGTNYSKTDDFGLPRTKDNSSSRQIWTTSEGFVRSFLNWCSYLYAYGDILANSSDGGRVVLARAAGAPSQK